jgi:hypothetical protein
MVAAQKQERKNNMKKSILDQFASDAINAPETVTGGRKGHTRTRTGAGAPALDKRTRTRTGRH